MEKDAQAEEEDEGECGHRQSSCVNSLMRTPRCNRRRQLQAAATAKRTPATWVAVA